jgi:hypothetical protein
MEAAKGDHLPAMGEVEVVERGFEEGLGWGRRRCIAGEGEAFWREGGLLLMRGLRAGRLRGNRVMQSFGTLAQASRCCAPSANRVAGAR